MSNKNYTMIAGLVTAELGIIVILYYLWGVGWIETERMLAHSTLILGIMIWLATVGLFDSMYKNECKRN